MLTKEISWTMIPLWIDPLTHYVIVRRDLPIGLMVAQVVHAAGESSNKMPEGAHAVVLGVDSERELRDVSKKLTEFSVRHSRIVDEDHQLTAIGCEPLRDRTQIRRVVSSVPLFRGSSVVERLA